ncbi:MAG: autotransporter outer membrane beta-barrel domain-containing protein, partial [Haliea sp.]
GSRGRPGDCLGGRRVSRRSWRVLSPRGCPLPSNPPRPLRPAIARIYRATDISFNRRVGARAGAANLTVGARRTDNTTASAGVKLSRPFGTAGAANACGMEFRAVASNWMGDHDSHISARLAGQAASFTANGTPLKCTALTLGAAVGGQLTRSVSAYADAAYGVRGSGQDAFKVAAGLRVAW